MTHDPFEIAKMGEYCEPSTMSKSAGCSCSKACCKDKCDSCSKCKGVSKAMNPGKLRTLQNISAAKVTKVPKPLGTSSKVAESMKQRSGAFGMRTPATNGRVAGVRAQNTADDLRGKLKKSFKNPSLKYQQKMLRTAAGQREYNDSAISRAIGGTPHKVISGDTRPPVAGLEDVAAKGRRKIAAKKARKVAAYTAGGTAAYTGLAVADKKLSKGVELDAFGVSKSKPPAERKPAFRPAAFNSRKQNVKVGTGVGAAEGAVIGGAIGAFGGRKSAAGAAALGSAFGAGTGALTGALEPHKGEKGAPKMQRAATDLHRAKVQYKTKRKKAVRAYQEGYFGV